MACIGIHLRFVQSCIKQGCDQRMTYRVSWALAIDFRVDQQGL
jgi:hypothetical protein